MYSPSGDEKIAQAQVQDRPFRIREALRVEAESAKDDDRCKGDNHCSRKNPRIEESPLVVGKERRATGSRAATDSTSRPLKQKVINHRSGN